MLQLHPRELATVPDALTNTLRWMFTVTAAVGFPCPQHDTARIPVLAPYRMYRQRIICGHADPGRIDASEELAHEYVQT